MDAQGFIHGAVPALMCSTPFGDIDGCTRLALDTLGQLVYVLNAFRRH